MLIEIKNARIVDPHHPDNGCCTSLYIRHGKFVEPPPRLQDVNQSFDLQGAWVLAGGIDIHTHIGGGKVNLARLLMPETDSARAPVASTQLTGEQYARMGYTSCFEPAMLLSGARHTHLELADTPGIDSGAYVVLGNEDWLLRALSENADDSLIDAMVGWSVQASQALAVKVVNPGGIDAFKYGQRLLSVDQPHVRWGITPRDVIRRLTSAVRRTGVAHPLHVHASNLGMPGNIAAALDTLAAAEGERIHLTHAQFNAYSSEGPFGMGSGAELLARYVNSHPNVSLDVGQIVFGQTVTISADTAAQHRNRIYAHPGRYIVNDIECQAGCGLVPMRYEDKQYVHSLQWTIGLELMLLIEDPWRVFLTTDHPNGGPFTSYPHLLQLLMDRSYRQSILETIHPRAAANSLLRELTREYTLDEVAIVTRAAPARILGLLDRGRLTVGAIADLAAYQPASSWEATFSQATLVMKQGEVIVRNGVWQGGSVVGQTITARPEYDPQPLEAIGNSIEQTLHVPWRSLQISSMELDDVIRRPKVTASELVPEVPVAPVAAKGVADAD
jgi:formylmethanofuran dehydrogenase subunit A